MTSKQLTDEDKDHIRRLQVLRDSGAVNMFTDLKRGLDEMFTDKEAAETYEWVKDNFEYYTSGDWVEVDT